MTLADIFITIIPMAIFTKITALTDKYCYNDWVIPKQVKDSRNNVKKRLILVPSDALVSGARHQADNEEKKYTITPGFILAWIGILVIKGAHFGSDKTSARASGSISDSSREDTVGCVTESR